jgi:hypothetical protein
VALFLSLFVPQSFSDGSFRITGSSEAVSAPFVSKSSADGPIRFKFTIVSIVGGVRGAHWCKVLSGVRRHEVFEIRYRKTVLES